VNPDVVRTIVEKLPPFVCTVGVFVVFCRAHLCPVDDKVRLFEKLRRAPLKAKESGGAPFEAIEHLMSWDAFTKSVSEAEQLAQPEAFDFLHQIGVIFSNCHSDLDRNPQPVGEKIIRTG
jgi:hypothetical protein